ncbi:MAG: thiol:disulfide interchange protein DsbA/DsbL [Pseudomonadales bacterium]
MIGARSGFKSRIAWFAALALIASAAFAEDASAPQEGVNYKRLPVAIETRDPSRIEVVEVFSYACIHCKNFEPLVTAWRAEAPAHVDFHQLPAAFDPTWALLAQAFFTAEALGVTEKVHELIFAGIHDDRVNLADPVELAKLFQDAAGVSPEEFNKVFNSFGIRSKVQQADARTRAYRVTGTPTLIVDGQFLVDARLAGSPKKMLEVVNYLVEQQWAQRAKSQ